MKKRTRKRGNPKNDYVDNERLYKEVCEHLQKLKDAEENGLPEPPMSEYIGKCMLLIPQNLSNHRLFRNYSFKDEMVSDAYENILTYFRNYDITRKNVFAYWSQISYFAFQRKKLVERKERYKIYKTFQENILDTENSKLMVDENGNGVITPENYDNINNFIKDFEDWEKQQKEKRKKRREGLEKFIPEKNDEEGREQ